MDREKHNLLLLHLRGYFLIILQVAIVSVFAVWTLQVIAMQMGETYAWDSVLEHIFLSLCLLAFFPGQTFWTYRLEDRRGRIHTIVGRDPQTEDAEG